MYLQNLNFFSDRNVYLIEILQKFFRSVLHSYTLGDFVGLHLAQQLTFEGGHVAKLIGDGIAMGVFFGVEQELVQFLDELIGLYML